MSLVTFAVDKGKRDAVRLGSGPGQNKALVAAELSQKLKSVLAQNDLIVKLKDVKEAELAGGQVEIRGRAECVLPNDSAALPVEFRARVNTAKRVVSDVQYSFVEDESAPSAEEEILMKELMRQISRDYKTNQITIALDDFETVGEAAGRRNVKGVGEVKIGEVDWRTISFDVVLDDEDKAAEVIYKLAQ